MTKLKMQIKQTYHVDYSDLERFIQNAYNVREFSIACDEETGNDTAINLIIIRQQLSEYDAERLAKFLTPTPPSFMLRTLMQDMCNRGLIPDGEYVINVSW